MILDNGVPQPTQGMWEMLSELLDGEKLPETLNAAIYALCEGKAKLCTNMERIK